MSLFPFVSEVFLLELVLGSNWFYGVSQPTKFVLCMEKCRAIIHFTAIAPKHKLYCHDDRGGTHVIWSSPLNLLKIWSKCFSLVVIHYPLHQGAFAMVIFWPRELWNLAGNMQWHVLRYICLEKRELILNYMWKGEERKANKTRGGFN